MTQAEGQFTQTLFPWRFCPYYYYYYYYYYSYYLYLVYKIWIVGIPRSLTRQVD